MTDPLYPEPVAVDAALPTPITVPPRVRRRPRWPGLVAVGCAVLTAVLVGAGVGVGTGAGSGDASGGGLALATGIAWVAVAVSAIGVLVGIVAAVGRFGRGAGVVGALLCVIANPPVLTAVLGFASGVS